MQDKKIYMQLGDGSDFESVLKQNSNQTEPEPPIFEKKMVERGFAEFKDIGFDSIKDSLFDGIEVVQLGGGMVSITMPLAVIEFLSKFVNKFGLENEQGVTR
ncbi:MAG: hypothetical protein A2W82_05435 [Sulfurimonas sp. RIFCSPLOWO2_12_36_12]|uniref:hypothetical protein n=1 Tax=Sulfurimonas sp. RIFCSPLOWO2_12_36_12 TaxID=1802253 RepID=UPI0008CC14EC|nr:hypothetical protein [Sulfurimonas sp. RIFCSPLOWO2_12_36_12]OHD99631.1 MAG: hypothetical protein A3J26_07905 [Sulfurimonas sp. RIFCSPLOWO2_02_FULL_36_28]OHE01372.1 MAG: hypothetical protein A2W82_05435 [Sulfurimonas sp. RIFCSPLOWO2_12_36_12]